MAWMDTIYGRRWVPDTPGPRPRSDTGETARQRLAEQKRTTAANNAYWGLPGSDGGPPVPAGAGTTTIPSSLSDSQKSAKAIIQRALDEYGLGGLGDRLWQQYLGGAPMEQIFLDLRKTPEWTAIYGVINEAAKKGIDLNESMVRANRAAYASLARQYQLPPGFYDSQDDFDRLILANRSPVELREDLDLYQSVAMQAPADVVSELQSIYGMTAGDLIAFWAEPDKAEPLLRRRQAVAGAGISAQARRAGFGSLNRTEADELVRLGVSDDAAAQGFATLAESRELFGVLPGEEGSERAIGRDEQLGAAFRNDTAARRRISLRARQRVAAFAGGGGFAGDRQGLSGIGAAS